MRWVDAARARLRLLFRRGDADSRIDEEIRFHIDMEAERLVREEGYAAEEARRRAFVAFGGVQQHKEALRADRGLAWISGMSLDFKLALRMLVKHPGLTLVSVLGMAVAVAIGAVTFSAIRTITDAKLPISEGERVVAIRNLDTRRTFDARATHLHDLVVWHEALTTVGDLGAYRIVQRNLITANRLAESVRIAEMTASGFRIARVPPLIGRWFHAEDERPGAAPVVIIGYDLWHTRFSARPDIVGQTIQIGDGRHTVIGVMPSGFAFPVNNRLWTPLRLRASDYDRGTAPSVEVFARLALRATIADARRQAATIAQRLAVADPEIHAYIRTRIVPYTRAFTDSPESVWSYYLAQLMVSMLLVVIGTNVAILVYARTASRMGEIAVRTALGASRGRVVAQLFAEGLVLSLLAAAVGLLVAHFSLQGIDAALTRIQGDQIPFWSRFFITPSVVAYAIGLAVLAAVIVGVVPALKATGRDVRANLQQLSAGGSGMRLGRVWTLLIVAQVAVAVAVLPVAIAGVSAWRRLETAEAKLAQKQILTATLFLDRPEVGGQRDIAKRSVLRKLATLGAAAPDSIRDQADFAARYVVLRGDLVGRILAEPGVTVVAFASNSPGGEASTRVEVDQRTVSNATRDTTVTNDAIGAVVGTMRVDLNYLSALDIPILAGRGFGPADESPATNVVLVNRSFVRKLLGGANPLGHRLRRVTPGPRAKADAAPPAPWEEIVGVVPDFPVDSGAPNPKIYRPLLPTSVDPVAIAVRVDGFPATSFANRLRELTIATNPMLRVERVKPLDQALSDETAGTRLVILALELVTLSTVLLSAAGIYALMAFTITRRRREIGIRAALGAGPRRVLTNVLSRVFVQISAGIVVGIASAGVIDHLLEGGWSGRSGPLGLGAVAALMLGVGLLAAIGPARRALLIQPTEALRAE